MTEQFTNLEDIFGELEGEQFAANMRVVAGFKVLLNALKRDRLLQRLTILLQENPQNRQQVISRITALLSQNDESGYLHPFDGAIAAYLYALNAVDQKQANWISSLVLATSQLWWSRRLAKQIATDFVSMANQLVSGTGLSEVSFMRGHPSEVIFDAVFYSEAENCHIMIEYKTYKASRDRYESFGEHSDVGNVSLENRGRVSELARVAS